MLRLALAALAVTLAAPAVAALPTDYDLRANLPLAHTWRAGVVADASDPVGFVKYTRDMRNDWKATTEDGRPAVLCDGVQANLWLPIDKALAGQDLVVEAVFKPIGKDQRMDPFINGKKAGNHEVTDGWNTLRLAIPAGQVTAGFAKVRLHFRRSTDHKGTKTAAAIRAVRIAPASAPALPADEAALKALLASHSGDSLVLPADGGLDYYVTPLKGHKLVGTATGGTVDVFAQVDGKAPQKLGGGASLDVALDPVAGQAVRLMLRGAGGTATLAGAKIKGGTVTPVTAKTPKYVVFWLIDTLRADKLAFYDRPNANKRKKVKTPNLSALAKEAAVFEPFYVQGTESKASHASLFTGTYPVVHKVYNEKANLSDSHTTIAEAFKGKGFATAGFCSNGYISDKWNYTQGFQTFTNFIREGKANNAQAVANAAIKWVDGHLEKSKDKPFYLYLGTSDPHVTYRRHEEFIGDYDDKNYKGNYEKYLSGEELGKIKGKKSPPAERHRKRIEALYENEIAFNDKHFGRLVDHLKAKGIWDETLVIITADHGDEFWEHGSCGHGHNLHQELVNVPLMIRYPGVIPAGKVAVGADGVDLLPTLMALLGQDAPKDVQGANLLPVVAAKGTWPMAVMASNGTDSFTLQVGPAKVIMRSEQSIQAYDVAADPAEQTDVFGDKLVTSLAAFDPLTLFLSRKFEWKKGEWGPPNNLTRAFK
ncbi:MAG: sulfatase [Myxococcales bacterium]|nr:sulfatase [Myxococcales bacterium]